LFINIERYLANKSTAIIAISEKQKNDLVNVFKIAPESKTHIVKLGFDLNKFNSNKTFKRELFRKQYKIKNDEIIVTIVGRLVPIKNHIFLIKAIDLIKDKLPDKVKFFIVGDGELRNELLNECSKRAIPYSWFPETQEPQLVTFISWQKEIDVVNAGSDLIVLCSHNEGTPVSLIEAQASGKPVISANVGGVADIVSHKTGLLYQPNNIEDFCEKLLKLLVDNNYREALAANGWNEMKQTFSYNRLINEMDNLYKKLLNA
jgi:glycosyltransferase involved in cell wall biosynthesis